MSDDLYQEIINSYYNGQFKQFTAQLDSKRVLKSEFIKWATDIMPKEEIVLMFKVYFKMKDDMK